MNHANKISSWNRVWQRQLQHFKSNTGLEVRCAFVQFTFNPFSTAALYYRAAVRGLQVNRKELYGQSHVPPSPLALFHLHPGPMWLILCDSLLQTCIVEDTMWILDSCVSPKRTDRIIDSSIYYVQQLLEASPGEESVRARLCLHMKHKCPFLFSITFPFLVFMVTWARLNGQKEVKTVHYSAVHAVYLSCR